MGNSHVQNINNAHDHIHTVSDEMHQDGGQETVNWDIPEAKMSEPGKLVATGGNSARAASKLGWLRAFILT